MPTWSAAPKYAKRPRAPRRTFPLPRFIGRPAYHLRTAATGFFGWIIRFFYSEPIFRARCGSVGEGFSMRTLPDVSGHLRFDIGSDVRFAGHMGVAAGRMFDDPRIVVGDGVRFEHDVTIAANREVVVESGVTMGGGCRIMDTDAHPRNAALRAANVPPPPEEVRPVRIGRNVAVGARSFVLKGVTIGEGATVGPGSVVVSDIPAFSVAAGNPARILARRTAADIEENPPSSSGSR